MKNKKNNKNIYKNIAIILFIILIILTIVLIYTKTNTNNKIEKVQNNEIKLKKDINIDDIKLEIYHFHGTSQCYSCITVGDLTKKTLDTYFKDELDSGKIKFDHINGELLENRDLVLKYGATGSSIFIGTYIGEEFHKEENTRVWYKINNEEDFMKYLKSVIEKRLKGDLY